MKPALPWKTLCIVAGVLLLALIVWKIFQRDFLDNLEAAAEHSLAATNSLIVFSNLTTFKWDKVYIYGPYTGIETIHADLGYKWHGAARTGIEMSEDFHLLVFTRNGRMIRHFEISRWIGDFQNLDDGNVFTPSNAVFNVREHGVGRVGFIPKR